MATAGIPVESVFPPTDHERSCGRNISDSDGLKTSQHWKHRCEISDLLRQSLTLPEPERDSQEEYKPSGLHSGPTGGIKMEKMILLLLTLTCCVCGTFETSYEAEENEDVTLEWTFTPADRSLDALNIDCAKVTNQKHWVLFRLADGVQVPESQDAQFAGRVHFDKDVLGEGRLRLNVTSLRVEDSGDYLCEYGEVPDVRRLTVRAARRSETEPERRSTESWGWKDFISNLGMISGLVALLIALCLNIYACWRPI